MVTPESLSVTVDALPLLGNPTGVGAFCRGALTALSRQEGLHVSAYAVTWRRRASVRERLPAGVRLTHRAMPARPLHALWSTRDSPPLEWFVGRSDLIHGTNSDVPPARAATLMTVHDLTPVRFPELSNRASPNYPDLIRSALRRGAWVHTDSEYVASEVRDVFGAPADRVRAIAPGIPRLATVPPRAREQAIDDVGLRGARYILSVGTAEPRKDLPGLVRAFDAVAGADPDLLLVLAGPPGWGEGALDAAIGAAHNRDRVRRLGWVSDGVLATLIDGASLLAYPSIYEGFGFPPLQAMAAGVPVVASSAGSLPEVLGDAACLVDPGDHDQLAGALRNTMEDDSARQLLIRRGRDRAATFSWTTFGTDMAQLYRDVVQAHRG